ncbi:MAG TPA: glucose-6-phosphate dehydrogenase [Chloroflexota bacterium]|nr:glucose-6-phosphate dehydrogenase [Chloroflexota bacterium]
MALDVSVATRDGEIVIPAQQRPAPPCALVIFGASGDLTHRKLIPALFDLFQSGLISKHFAVLGFSRSPLTNEDFRRTAREGLEHYTAGGIVSEKAWEEFSACLHYTAGQFDQPASYETLRERLEKIDAAHGTQGNRIFYLATPPELFKVISAQLGDAKLNERRADHCFVRLVIEKPFGVDLQTALELNKSVQSVFQEHQVYRIDHYLGKETVQNLLAFRLANGIFEPIWNRNFVDHVQLTVAETVGVERRGGYYDEIGAFRDVIENHMLQLLSIVAMEPPVVFEAEPVRDEKLKVLKALRRIPPEQTGEYTLRGQYTSGKVADQAVSSYRGEEKVAPDSWTETFVVMRLQIDNWRWAGTPFYLRHGKRLPTRATEIAIQFKRAPQMFFPGEERLEANVLAMRIQPDEGISLRFGAKVPGPTMQLQEVDMNFLYGSSFGPNAVASDAYERLLLDAMLGDRTLFTRADEVEQAWKWAEDIQEGWAQRPNNVHFYPAGTWGPAWADAFIERDGRQWRRL